MRFLVDSCSSVGDVAIEVPLFRCIARNGHHIEVVVGESVAGVLEDCDFISVVHFKGSTMLEKFATYWQATRKPLDVILASRFKPNLMLSSIGAVYRRKRLSTMYDSGAIKYRLSILDGVIEDWDKDIQTEIPFSPERTIRARAVAGIGPNEPYLTVAPVAKDTRKQWPLECFIEVIKHLRSYYAQIAIVGSPNEAQVCQQIAKECATVNLAGKLDLADTCALVSCAIQHLGNDGGLGHVAAGNGVPTIAVGGQKHYIPWRQCMIQGYVNAIGVRQVLDAMGVRRRG